MKYPCMICGGESRHSFVKTYRPGLANEYLAHEFTVEYRTCRACGFTFSATHQEMSAAEWESLNYRFHHHIEQNPNARTFNQPPYPEQVFAVAALVKNSLIGPGDILDFASGYGSMAKLLSTYFGIDILLYDPYVQESNGMPYVGSPSPAGYDMVINSAMFEHVRSREELDQVASLVGESGCLMLHTLVCESVPVDPDWFYLNPIVHCAFHTNRSMQLLMDEWGFNSSIYSLPARSWWLFRREPENIDDSLRMINESFARDWFLHQRGFLDYWKE